MDEGEGCGCISVLIFLGVWVACIVSFGGLGFMFGWLPALVLAFIWPLILSLGVLLIVGIIILIAILFALHYIGVI